MSDLPSGGSPYGLGAYGRGPYGYATRIMGMRAGTTARLRPQLIVQGQLNITAPSFMSLGLTLMWAALPVEPCQGLWQPTGTPGCWQVIPNSIGNMFPGMQS